MKAEENKTRKLNKEESDFIKALVLRNDALIRNVLKGVFADRYLQLTDECIAETYLLACERAEVLKDHPNPDGWIIKAAKTKALELNRKDRDGRTVPLDRAEARSVDTTVEDEAQYNIWKERFYISEVLGELSKREKQIYYLIYMRRVTVAEAAKELGISAKTVLNVKRKIVAKVEKLLYK